MKIEQIPINQLEPYANNPKAHPTAQIDQIAASIEAFGFRAPLLIDADNTLIACEKTGRTCYGMEIEPHYCDIIVKRWEDYTGQKATRNP
jgi:hypothetical protein